MCARSPAAAPRPGHFHPPAHVPSNAEKGLATLRAGHRCAECECGAYAVADTFIIQRLVRILKTASDRNRKLPLVTPKPASRGRIKTGHSEVFSSYLTCNFDYATIGSFIRRQKSSSPGPRPSDPFAFSTGANTMRSVWPIRDENRAFSIIVSSEVTVGDVVQYDYQAACLPRGLGLSWARFQKGGESLPSCKRRGRKVRTLEGAMPRNPGLLRG